MQPNMILPANFLRVEIYKIVDEMYTNRNTHLTHQSTHAFDKTHIEASTELLHVSAPGCHHQAVVRNKGAQTPQANLGTVSPLLE
jgi:hypothetical protein